MMVIMTRIWKREEIVIYHNKNKRKLFNLVLLSFIGLLLVIAGSTRACKIVLV